MLHRILEEIQVRAPVRNWTLVGKNHHSLFIENVAGGKDHGDVTITDDLRVGYF